MSAVVGVLNESLTESLRGFYKLRKAFSTLHEISEAERKYLEARGKGWTASQSSVASAATVSENQMSAGSQTPAEGSGVLTPDLSAEEDDDMDFVDAEEAAPDSKTSGSYQGHLEAVDFEKLNLDEKTMASKLKNSKPPAYETANASVPSTGAAAEADQFDLTSVTTDPVDLFIHTGTALCFGLLQLLLSMVPPAFNKLLLLFSFRGDRETGFRMLWSATKFKTNVNGAFAGLITLGFHNAAIAFCDILTKDAMPEARLKALLREMRQLYPKSRLWLLEEARMLAHDHELEKAVEVIKQGPKSPLKQVEALRMFEKALSCMYLHRYEECATSFIACVGMNNWSHALYYYISGICYVELYRTYKGSDPTKAEEYAVKAEKYLHEATTHTGKKKFMARQLPFDVYVNRKVAKWDSRATSRVCRFVDAVGVSPVEEMSYFWSGFKRMNASQLRDSLDRLAWFEDPNSNPYLKQEPDDEKAVFGLLKATCLRFLGNIPEAKSTLTSGVFSHDLPQLKACDHPDTWPLPVGHYEMAVCLWEEAGGQDGDRAGLEKCSAELSKVEHWESFELEARVGMKVATARQTLQKCGIKSL